MRVHPHLFHSLHAVIISPLEELTQSSWSGKVILMKMIKNSLKILELNLGIINKSVEFPLFLRGQQLLRKVIVRFKQLQNLQGEEILQENHKCSLLSHKCLWAQQLISKATQSQLMTMVSEEVEKSLLRPSKRLLVN